MVVRGRYEDVVLLQAYRRRATRSSQASHASLVVVLVDRRSHDDDVDNLQSAEPVW